MQNLFGRTGDKNSRRLTLFLCMICCGSLIAAFIVGISDNLSGLGLCYAAAISIILAFVHKWRKVKYFLFLLGASLVSFPVFVVLHNVFYALGQIAADIIVLSQSLEFLHAVFFLIAVLVCPAGFLIGALGSIVAAAMYLKKKRIQNKAA